MKTQLIKMLKTVGEYNENEQYEIDTETAEKWLSDNICEKVETLDDRFETLSKSISDAVDSKVEKAMEKINKALNVEIEAPAVHVDKSEQRSFTSFMKATLHNDTNTIRNDFGEKALSGTDGGSGGFLIPEQYSDQILEIANESSFCLSRVNSVNMTGDTYSQPVIKQSGTTNSSNGGSNFYQGIYFEWTEDDQTKPGSKDFSLDKIKLEAKESSGHTVLDNYLYDDAPANVEEKLKQTVGKAYAHLIDSVIIGGNGIGKPHGFIPSSASKGVTRATDDNNADIWTDVTSMMGACHDPNEDAIWIINKSVQASMLRMGDEGNNTIWAANAATTGPTSLYGRPVFYTEKNPASGSKGDICLASLSNYLFGMRGGLKIAKSEHVYFLKNQSAIRFTARMDGRPMLDSPITLSDQVTTVSPFVVRNA
ncbi:Phage capsid family protein [Polystyrenella longa]|uniref:Phage capsid family protein n=1 Tax=Polystyrenella longa TaxID=2528007 RepID=A0A518CQS8_9PLAN|nr:phage major capsid protein [Polystyrenella longa]QDU81554.1 Phage capsid family protein [Polystyrenella longa]